MRMVYVLLVFEVVLDFKFLSLKILFFLFHSFDGLFDFVGVLFDLIVLFSHCD